MAIVIGSNTFNGRSVQITNNRVIIDGVDVTGQLPEQKEYKIEINGNIDKIHCDRCNTISVTGDVGGVSTQSGDIECGTVSGSISTMSGDVDCGHVGGSISTMSGDVKHRKPK